MLIEKSTPQLVNLYYDLYIPDGKNRPLPLLIALHGYEGNKESMMARARSINDGDFVIAALQGPNAFLIRDTGKPRVGFGWMMQYKSEETIKLHHNTVLSMIEEAESHAEVDRKRIVLMGFSQSVSLNYRFAFTYPGMIKGVVAVCGGIPGDWDQDKYHSSATDIIIVAGESDEFYPPERTGTFADALRRRAPSVKYHLFPGGHSFHPDSLRVINHWLKERI